MARNRPRPAKHADRLAGFALGAVAWASAAAASPGIVGADFDEAGRRLEERLEQQIERSSPADPAPEPSTPRPAEGDAIQPWELVRV